MSGIVLKIAAAAVAAKLANQAKRKGSELLVWPGTGCSPQRTLAHFVFGAAKKFGRHLANFKSAMNNRLVSPSRL
jgi:hypothetical protein